MDKSPTATPSWRVTIADLAEALGLSRASVAAALSNSSGNTRVSDETRKRVSEMAERMNYRVNTSARALNQRVFKNIGFFAVKKNSDDYTFAEMILDGIAAAASRHGQNVVLVRIPEYVMGSDNIPSALREACLDALIVENVANMGKTFRDAVEASSIPVVYLNDKRPQNSVYVQDDKAGAMMTGHLIKQGFSKIAILAPNLNNNHYSFMDRICGYKSTMRKAGLEPVVWDFPSENWKEATARMLNLKDRPDAIFCADDQIALCLQQILYRLNIRFPEQLAIAGCNGEAFSAHSMVPLTTLKIPFREMSEAAVDMAMSLVRDRARGSLPSLKFVPELIVEESTRFFSPIDSLTQ